MVLCVPRSKQEEEAIEIEKIAWFFVCNNYEEFRKIKGCDKFINLAAVTKDLKTVIKIADSMGIPNDSEHRIISINPSREELMEAYEIIVRKQVIHMANNTPIFLFVYFGGHGISHMCQ